MTAKSINVGLIGTKFMGKAHSNAYLKVAKFFDCDPVPVMKAICGRHVDETAEFAKRFGWESHEADWRKLCERKDIDVVDISTPGSLHHEMAIAAAKAGKHVFCEKPLAFNLKDAREMLEAVRQAGVVHLVNFNYRVVPALALAQQMIAGDEIGEVRHVRATYLQDWLVDPKFPMNWRLRKEAAGSGSNGDLNSHHIDLARYLTGDEITEVVGMQKTFITERPAEGRSAGLTATAGEGTEKVTVDDATLFLAKFAKGALGSFEATRLAPGRKNYNRVEVNGSRGSIVFNFEEMNTLDFYSTADPPGRQGFRRIMATEGAHPYVAAWWPPGHILGYEHTFVHAVYELMNAIKSAPSFAGGSKGGANPTRMADFRDGAQCVAVLDAVAQSIEEHAWAKVESVK